MLEAPKFGMALLFVFSLLANYPQILTFLEIKKHNLPWFGSKTQWVPKTGGDKFFGLNCIEMDKIILYDYTSLNFIKNTKEFNGYTFNVSY